MHIKYSINILMSRYGIIFKMIAYCTIFLFFFLAISYAIAAPLLSDVTDAIRETGWNVHIRDFIADFFDGDGEITDAFRNIGLAFSEIIEILENNQVSLIKAICVFIAFGAAALYILNLANLSYSDIINHFMNSNSRFGFISNFFYNLKKSAVYSLIYLFTKLPLTILVYVIVGFVVYGIAHTTWWLFALPVGYIVWIILITFVNILFMGWAPAITADGIPVFKALDQGFNVVGKHFVYAFMNSFMVSFLSTIFIAFCTTCTFGAGLLIAIPTSIMFRKILELVLYYSAKNYKFYTANGLIIQGELKN